MNNNYNGYPYFNYQYPNMSRNIPNYSFNNTMPRSGGLLSRLFSPASAVNSISPITGAATGASTFSFSGLLNGASKTLGVINQAIPVFYQVKPIWNNAKTMFRVAKELNSNNNNSKSDIKDNTQSNTNTNKTNYNNKNEPIFFK